MSLLLIISFFLSFTLFLSIFSSDEWIKWMKTIESIHVLDLFFDQAKEEKQKSNYRNLFGYRMRMVNEKSKNGLNKHTISPQHEQHNGRENKSDFVQWNDRNKTKEKKNLFAYHFRAHFDRVNSRRKKSLIECPLIFFSIEESTVHLKGD